jgi:putative membrane protein
MMHGSGPVMRGFGHGFSAIGQNGWMGFIPMMAFHLIFLITIIVLAVIFFKRHGSKVRTIQKQNDPALKILRERYALGEIDTEDYERRKQDLSS